MIKLGIGFIVLVCLVIMYREWRKADKEEDINEDLHDELDKVNFDLRKADVEEQVVDAKSKLKGRRETIHDKETKLDGEPVISDEAEEAVGGKTEAKKKD